MRDHNLSHREVAQAFSLWLYPRYLCTRFLVNFQAAVRLYSPMISIYINISI